MRGDTTKESVVIAMRWKRYDAAVKLLTVAARFAPADARVMNNLGVACELSGRPERAEFYYLKALSLNPACAEAADNLCSFYLSRGKYAEARRYARLLQKLEGGFPYLTWRLARAAVLAGDLTEAASRLQAALAEDPSLAARTLAEVIGATGAPTAAHRLDAGPLPVAPEAFHNITIPLRADKSWHEVDLKIEFGGQAYKGEEGLPLANDIWQEATWQLETPEEKNPKIHRVKDYIPLVDAGGSIFAEPGKMLVTMTVRRTSHASAIVRKFTRNYEEALRFIPFMKYVRNSVFLVIMNVVGQIVSCSLIAYAFARLKWPGREFFFVVLLGTMMLPPQVTMIPVFLIMKRLGWFNTLYPMWVPAFFAAAHNFVQLSTALSSHSFSFSK